MKTAGKYLIVLVGLTVSLAGVLTSCAQGTYSQPGYGQPGYGQNQPDYNQPGYNNQPGYGQNQPGYNQPGYDNGYNNQPGYNQYSGQPQDFYNDLGPYGQWVQTPQYGTVWIPNVPQGFQPYATNGHWVVTEYGNTWVSDYAWGWGPFHYGRWYQDPRMGWAWVPGYDWGPAWVSWRSGGGYYGWAPLGPGMNINVNINIPANYWVFVPQVYITSPSIYSYYVPRPRVVTIYQQTTIINNVYRANNRVYAYGPQRDEIERVTRRSVPVYRIENSGRPGRDEVRSNSIGIYRPEPTRGTRDSRGNSSRVYNAPFDNTRGNNGSRTNGSDSPNPAGTYGGGAGRSNGGSYNGNGQSNGGAVTTPAPGGYSGRGSRGSGTYTGDASPQPTPTDANTSVPQRNGPTRGGGTYGRPNYEAQQNQPMTQTQQSQPVPQPSRQEMPAQGQWNRGNRMEPAPQRESGAGRVGNAQPQEQRGQGGQPQGGYSSGRGSSRGNN
ncbi:DUF6600 domain-containing protein [uncultured Fibrella sp.]|uniref:DUF6600 domain-containing protein n=1 Tax=uncultured Fibrella sp. TaxID=1284596 RepID=UPI0035C99D85